MSLANCPTCAPIPEWDWLEANGYEPLSFTYTVSGGAMCVIGPTDAPSLACWTTLIEPPEIVRGSPVRLIAWLGDQGIAEEVAAHIVGPLRWRACTAPPEPGWRAAEGDT